MTSFHFIQYSVASCRYVKYAHIGMYLLLYIGAVFGANGLAFNYNQRATINISFDCLVLNTYLMSLL